MWKQKVEAQIAELQHEGWYATDSTEAGPVAATMQALLDVAVAAEELDFWATDEFGQSSSDAQDRFRAALDKLREVGDVYG